jgi:beta-lactamase regulating signal transducer with metallopeptidase domain
VSSLVSAVWEGALLAGCVYLFLRMFPGLSAAARSVVWLHVFALLVVLEFVPAMGAHGAPGVARSAPFELEMKWGYAVAGVWAALSLLRAAQLIWSALRSSALARRAIPVEAGDGLRPLLKVGSATGQRGRVAELCLSDEVERPSVFGFFHPRILLPPALMEELTAEELQQVVVHEMEHLRRRDDWTNLLQKTALVVFPLNPALVWVERRLCAERELACDDSVLRASRGRKAYAICLTRLAEYAMVRRSLTLVLGAWERQSEVGRRVHRILRRPVESMSRRQQTALTAGLMAAVLAGGAGLARSPRLVSFVPQAQLTAQARMAPEARDDARVDEASAGRGGNMAGLKAEMVKAEMPESAAKSPRHSSLQGAFAARPVRTDAVLRSSNRRPAVQQQQTWVVLTEWSGADTTPQLVFAVQHEVRVVPKQNPDQDSERKQTSQPRYAAVPFANGWLIVQI